MSVPRSVWTDRPDDVWTGSLSRCRLNGACLDKHPSRRRLDGAVQAASVHAPPPLHTQTPPSGRLSLGFTQAGSVWWESWFYPFLALLFCSHSVSPSYPPPDRAHVMSCGRSVIIITAVQYMNRPSAAATWAAITQPVSPCGSRSIFDSKYGVQIASKKIDQEIYIQTARFLLVSRECIAGGRIAFFLAAGTLHGGIPALGYTWFQ